MKKLKITYIALCMILCAVPLFGMTVRPTTETTENRRMTEFPALVTENGLNLKFFSTFEKYFSEHFAFRNELVAADGMIQGKLFKTSAVANVIYGSDGWLYYTSTLGDYAGTNAMNEQERKALQHNLSVVQEYLKEKGISFVFTVPPNKNTLYGNHMPYYADTKISDDHTLYHLKDLCEQAGIPYADLYDVLKNESETVYLKRDSHWNNKGAVLAYETIMEETGHPYESYKNVSAARKKTEDGDLNRMLYTFYGEKEVNYYYDIPVNYTYANENATVEDGWIEAECPSAEGRLLMFRDSFGNTLVPLFANQYAHSSYSKESPYRLEMVVNEQSPDTVIFEKVERNLRDFITNPPIITMPMFKENLPVTEELQEDGIVLTAEENMFDPGFLELKGTLGNRALSEDAEVVLGIDGTYVNAYDNGENGFMAYLKKETAASSRIPVEVLIREDHALKVIFRTEVETGE